MREGLAGEPADMREGLAGEPAEMREGLAGEPAEMREGLAGEPAEMREDLDTTFHVNDINTKLDLILTGDSERISTYGQFPAPGFSHHDLTFASVKLKSPKQRPRIVMHRNFAAVDHDRLRIDAEALDWSQLYNASNIDDMVSAFNKSLTALYDKHAQIVPVRMKKRPAPWLTDGIRKLMAKRNSLYRRYRKSPCAETFSKFKKQETGVTR
ncbi:reverse transcriptase [Operophtera brumata]|uniref:Reverse transcriptase n=1 Tax=Operophtera brumata TaxID=104452 RepID=A0A0L7L645_OPEBR|nr:reverse transcriptase [Operophtera brumata]